MAEHEPDASTASASEVLSYRQRLEKPAGGEIVLMKWSPTMDLLAATFADNSVRYTHFIFTVRSYLCVFLRSRRKRLCACAIICCCIWAQHALLSLGNCEQVVVAASLESPCTKWHTHCTSMET